MKVEKNILIDVEDSDVKNGTVFISSEIEQIAKWSFSSCSRLKYVILPNNIKRIGRNAFTMCQNLQKVSIPNSVCEIGAYAFRCDNHLQEIKLSDNVKLERKYFYDCPEKCKVHYRGHTYLVEDILEYY